MIQTSGGSRTSIHWIFWIVCATIAVVLGAFVATSLSILRDSKKQELTHADAIIVFGAAQYDGHPSPVFRARLDHAYRLFEDRLAPTVITTGGSAADLKYSEGGVGRDYLIHKGIPESAVLAETEASDTAESAEWVAGMMSDDDMKSCIAVSDAYHMFRIRKLLSHQGLRVFLAPRPDSRPKSVWLRIVALTKESASYLLWKVGLWG
ncbi:MAG TPA: YdcF family protein [Terriglobales bacterium]|jgi:uncharacterized SAM-binding protein YcdF (DUF218 family)